jgi:FkbM family methyltransferase
MINKIRNLIRTLTFIKNHPLNQGKEFKSILTFFKWQVTSFLMPFPIIYNYTERSKLIIRKTGATGNLYCGFDEFEDMGFLVHFLRPGDLFIDVGANIGSFTVLASAHCQVNTIAFEPVPATYQFFSENVRLNNVSEKVLSYRCALGGKEGKVNFTNNLDSTNHVVVNGESESVFEVEIKTLDSLVKIQAPTLIKIDVEGFETEVLNGALEILKSPLLKAIIIELNGAGASFGFNEDLIREKLHELGFRPYHYNPLQRKLSKFEEKKDNNTIYIRDIEYVTERLLTAEKLKLFNVSF